MSTQELQARLGNLAEAVADINRRSASVERIRAQLGNAMTALESRADYVEGRVAEYEGWLEDKKAEKAIESDAGEHRKALQNLATIMGEHSSAAFALSSEKYQAQLRDLNEAIERGYITQTEYKGAIAQATEQYKDLQAAAEGKHLAGQAGADLFRMARAPLATVSSAAGDQASGVANGLMGLMNSLPIAGGIWGLMMHGYMEADRMAAEAGEMVNIISSARGTASKGAEKYLAGFQEHAQKTLGIARQEVQGTLKVYVEAGLTMDDVMSVHRAGLGEVGHDAVTLSLALDKHFEWSGGQSAQLAMSMVKDRGASLEDAVGSLQKMAFAAQAAGTGVSELLEVATRTSGELQGFGVDAENVAAVMLSTIDRYKELGVGTQLAQRYAQQGVGEISAGLHQAPMGLKVLIGEEMGLGEGVDAAYAVQDAVASKDKNRLTKLISAAYNISKAKTKNTSGGSDDVRQREWLEPVFGFEGSRMITEMGSKLDEHGQVKDLDDKGWAKLKDSFTTEAEKTSQLERSKETIMKGMASMGQGLFQLIANFAAMMIISIKAMMSMDYVLEGGAFVAGKIFSAVGLGEQASGAVIALGGNMTGREERVAKIKAQYQTYFEGASQGALQVIDGAKQSGKGVGEIFGPILAPVGRALRFKIGSGGGDEGPVTIESEEDRVRAALFGEDGGQGMAAAAEMEEGGKMKQVTHREGAPEVVNAALAQVGAKAKGLEPNIYSRGRAEWWCMDFVGWAYEQIDYSPWGAFTDSMWGTYKYKGYMGMEAWGRETGHWRDPIGYIPQPGDIFFLERWSGSVPGEGTFEGEHVGMVVDILPDGRLWTVEGNAVHNGVNGVWTHARDPSRGVFRGFVTTERSGKSSADSGAKRKYLEKTIKNHERKKKIIAARTAARIESNRKLVGEVAKRAEAAGQAFSSTEQLVSSAAMEAAASGPATMSVQASSQPTAGGPSVNLAVDLSQIKLESGSVRESLGVSQ